MDLADSYHQIGKVWKKKSDLSKAALCYEKALAIVLACYGTGGATDLDLAFIYNKLA